MITVEEACPSVAANTAYSHGIIASCCAQAEVLSEATAALHRRLLKHMNWFLTVYITLALFNCLCTLARPDKSSGKRPACPPCCDGWLCLVAGFSADCHCATCIARCAHFHSPLRGSLLLESCISGCSGRC